MQPISERALRASFVNVSQRERNGLTLPPGLDSLDWDRLDYLGWRDARIPSLGYVVVHLDGEPVGVMLRQGDGRTRSRPQCSWCEDVLLPNDVVLFSAKRAGAAGRNGNTVATLVCSHFECSANVRKRPPVAYIGFDVDAARLQRIASLQQRAAAFIRDIRDGT
jgi:FBP C-terminal treble-clef zinc-finger